MVDACTITVCKIRKQGMPPNIHKHCILQQRLVKKRGHCFLVGQTSPFLAWSLSHCFLCPPVRFVVQWAPLSWKAEKWGSCSREDTLQHSKTYANSSVIVQFNPVDVRDTIGKFVFILVFMILDVAPTDLVVYLRPEWTTPTMGPSTVQWDTDLSTPDCQTPKKTNKKKKRAGALCCVCRTDRKNLTESAHKCKK